MGNSDLAAKNRLSGLIMLHHLLAKVPLLAQSLAGCNSAIVSTATRNLTAPALDEIRVILADCLNPEVFLAKGEARLQAQRLQAVKTGTSGLIDAARQILSENVQDIVDLYHAYVSQCADFPNLKLRFDARRGYYLSLPEKDILPEGSQMRRHHNQSQPLTLPSEFLQVTHQGGAQKTYIFTTAKLASLSMKHLEIVQEILHLSDQVIDGTVSKVRQHAKALFAVADSIAYIDMLYSFAAYAKSDSAPFSMPRVFSLTDTDRVTKSLYFSIYQGRHPLMTSTSPSSMERNFVPTNFELAQPREKTLMVVTGPNNSGKTTFITQVALITIIAQMGCFVPAESAAIPVFDKMFTRVGSQDQLERNASTFMREMSDLALILQNATSTSLVIIDELGRSTTPEEGEAICLATCENLVDRRVLTAVSTHFKGVSEGLSMTHSGGVRHVQLAVEVDDERGDTGNYRSIYVVEEGFGPSRISAIDSAVLYGGLHPDIAERARHLREILIKKSEGREQRKNLRLFQTHMLNELIKATQLLKEGKLSGAAFQVIVSKYRTKMLEKFPVRFEQPNETENEPKT